MEYRRLGRTDLTVSAVCLGTMTWGVQNTREEAFAQMDLALDRGVTFWDTAEMYPVPPGAETYGATESIIGDWFASRGGRDRIVLATKAIGRAPGGFGWVRGGTARLDRANLVQAVEDSLRRLRTDHIDLYQLHWPDRPADRFGRRAAAHAAGTPDAPPETPIEETLEALAGLVTAGKIRHVGVSNETPWGVMTFLAAAEWTGFPRIVSIQNPYNLLNRTFEDGLSEIAGREQVGLLAYSPMAAGTLSGKYLGDNGCGGAPPPGSRRAIDPRRSRYDNPRGIAATAAYVNIARRHGLDPAQMALAFVHRQPFVTATIVGATSIDQLTTDLDAFGMDLPVAVSEEIGRVHAANPNPCP
ncbi:aldo/keto reductase [Rhodocista pekingensis]|uniref:Aldo/keto reductase n=1 Tax=Rhodocista pekingensis TaxID=201185 RepID=A0ABW2KTY9_9PROT